MQRIRRGSRQSQLSGLPGNQGVPGTKLSVLKLGQVGHSYQGVITHVDVWILQATFTKNHKFNFFYIIQGLVSKEKQIGYTAILKE